MLFCAYVQMSLQSCAVSNLFLLSESFHIACCCGGTFVSCISKSVNLYVCTIHDYVSWDSSASILTRLQPGWPRDCSLIHGRDKWSFPKVFRLAVVPTQPYVQCVSGTLFCGEYSGQGVEMITHLHREHWDNFAFVFDSDCLKWATLCVQNIRCERWVSFAEQLRFYTVSCLIKCVNDF